MRRTQNKQILAILHKVGGVADSLGYECYVVGGYVRDFFMGLPNNDLDFVVVGSGERPGLELARELDKENTISKLSVYESYGTAKVDIDGFELEFVGARKEFYHRESRNPIVEKGTLQDDLERRDLTINNMAICVNAERFGELIDPFNGSKDLEEGLIRTPLDPNITFSDDPLRMLRAIRFACRLGFKIEESTYAGIMYNANRIQIIVKERITEELRKMMVGEDPIRAFRLLQDTGLLKYILPEVDALAIPDHKGHHKDIFKHTMQVLGYVLESDDEWIRWAALLHDVGKPTTKKFENGEWTFYNHAEVGAKMVRKIFQRLGLPMDARMEKVEKLVKLHMRPQNLCNDGVTDSGIRRLLLEAGEDIDDLILLCKGDITSSHTDKVQRFREAYDELVVRMREIEEADHLRNFQPPLKGDEIMNLLDLPPCKRVGQLKETIKDAILDGIIPNDHDSALQYLMNLVHEREL